MDGHHQILRLSCVNPRLHSLLSCDEEIGMAAGIGPRLPAGGAIGQKTRTVDQTIDSIDVIDDKNRWYRMDGDVAMRISKKIERFDGQ